LLFKVQRGSDVVDMWTVKRKNIGGGDIDKNPSQASKVNAKKKISYDDNDNTPIHINNKNNTSMSHNIISVDDEQDILYSFKTILSNHGYDVKSFTESKEALKHIFCIF
jgi:PleD family two-component response regulator